MATGKLGTVHGVIAVTAALLGVGMAAWSMRQSDGLFSQRSGAVSLASPSPIAAVGMPATARAIVDNFYDAYSKRDRDRLPLLFTSDITKEDVDAHMRLFSADDPLLFAKSEGDAYPTEYSVTAADKQGSDWSITVVEKRKTSSQEVRDERSVELLLVPAGSSWLIDRYWASGSIGGKYAGFLL